MRTHRHTHAALLLAFAAGSAVAQPALVVAPRSNSAADGASSVQEFLIDKLQSRTYQSRLLSTDLRSAVAVSPANAANTDGDISTAVLLAPDLPYTIQWRIPASDLASIPVGAQIDRLTTRGIFTEPAWPAQQPVVINDYEITLAADPNPAQPLGTSYANNQLNPVLVRRGPLVIPTDAFPAGNTRRFGRDITFGRPYTYTGGNLIITITHNGGSGRDGRLNSDAFLTPGAAVAGSGFRGTNGSIAGLVPVVRLGVAGVPVGAELTGIRWRQDRDAGPLARPTERVAWQNFELTFAEDATGGAPLSTNFNQNQLRPLLARTGEHIFQTGAFPFNSTLSPFSLAPVNANRLPRFRYHGGNLIYTVRHSGSDNSPFIEPDAASSGGSLLATSNTAATGAAAPTAVVRLDFCPSQQATVPISASNTQSTSTSLNTLIQSGPRRYQVRINASQLAGITPGDVITSIAFDSLSSGAWPQSDVTFADFEVRLGAAPGAMTSFGSNFEANAGASAVVRRGPLTIPANQLTSDRPFDFVVPVAPFQYNGGDLVLSVRHTGSTGNNFWFLGTVATSPDIALAQSAVGFDTANGSAQSAFMMRFGTRPPTPADVVWTAGPLNQIPFGHAAGDLVPEPNDIPSAWYSANGNGDFFPADDFDVLDPRGTRVTGATFIAIAPGTAPNTNPITAARVTLWSRLPRTPGSVKVAEGASIAASTFTGAYWSSPTLTDYAIRRVRVDFDTPQMLAPGRYWAEFVGSTDAPFGLITVALIDPCGRGVGGNAGYAFAPGGFMPLSEPTTFPLEIHGAPIVCAADLDNSGEVDLADFFAFFNCFADSSLCADVDMNLEVDLNDFFDFLNAFAAGC